MITSGNGNSATGFCCRVSTAQYAVDGRYVVIDKGRLATLLQKRFAVDTVVQGRNGNAAFIEEKIVRWPRRDYPYDSMCLETQSCTVPGHESDGWMVYGQADYLLYCFAQRDGCSLICFLMDFPKLQTWFWPVAGRFSPFENPDTINRSCGKVVPISLIRANVPTWCRRVDEAGAYNGEDDFAESLKEGYRAIRERVANGGPPWTPK